MDVVYNHTAEGNHMGPTLSFKGIDNQSYYRLVEGDEANYFDTTGTGNSLNVSHPSALGLITDSLRYWVEEMHVDGFRFDLATTLTRQDGEAEKHSAFLDIIHQDPVLREVKMIAEPWDTAGYQVGGFPADWSEWNGKYRDDLRAFWRGDEGTLGDAVQRVLGSPDVYEGSRRSPLCSVDFITAHDGFTLADLTMYAEKHNEANGEDNNDGESDNTSFNGGIEGPTDDGAVNDYRDRQRRNFLGTLLLSAGVPMILGGDEIARSQGGNNNAYCQDDEISWFDWAAADQDLLAFTTSAIAFRREHPALRPEWYRTAPGDSDSTVQVLRADAQGFEDTDWADGGNRAVILVLTQGEDAVAVLLNASDTTVEFTLPEKPGGGAGHWGCRATRSRRSAATPRPCWCGTRRSRRWSRPHERREARCRLAPRLPSVAGLVGPSVLGEVLQAEFRHDCGDVLVVAVGGQDDRIVRDGVRRDRGVDRSGTAHVAPLPQGTLYPQNVASARVDVDWEEHLHVRHQFVVLSGVPSREAVLEDLRWTGQDEVPCRDLSEPRSDARELPRLPPDRVVDDVGTHASSDGCRERRSGRRHRRSGRRGSPDR